MYDLLFTDTKALKKSNIDGYAKKLGLDLKKFATDLNSKKVKDAIAADQKLRGLLVLEVRRIFHQR